MVFQMNPKSLIKVMLSKLGWEITRATDPGQLSQYRRLHDADVLSRKPFYNVGAGAFFHPCWTNIDFSSEWYRPVQHDFIQHDLMSLAPLPLAESSAKLVYTSHTIEHVSEAAVGQLFAEVFRILEPGGIFRIVAPDAKLAFDALQRNDAEWFAHIDSCDMNHAADIEGVSLAESWLHGVATALSRISKSQQTAKLSEAQILDAIASQGFPAVLDHFCSMVRFDPARPGCHISWWTHDKVMQYLRTAGFSNVYRSGWQQSAAPLLRNPALFDSTLPEMSLFVEAVK